MNIKRFGIILLVVAMFVSMFSFTSFAAGEKVTVTYENMTTGKAKTDPIVSGDTFFAVVQFTGFTETTLGGGNIGLNFNKDVINVCASNGTPTTAFTGAASTAIHSTAMFDNYELYAMETANAFETVGSGNSVSNITGKVTYNFSSKISDGNVTDAPIENWTLPGTSIVVLRVRFKVIANGNTGISFTTDETSFKYTLSGAITYPTSDVTPLTIGTTEKDEIAATVNGVGKVVLTQNSVDQVVTSGLSYEYAKDSTVTVTAYPAMGYAVSGATYGGSSDGITIDADGSSFDVVISGSKALVITFSARTLQPKPQTCKKFFTETVNSVRKATSFGTKPTALNGHDSIKSYGILLTDSANNEVTLYTDATKTSSITGHFAFTKALSAKDQFGIEFVGLNPGNYYAQSFVQYNDDSTYEVGSKVLLEIK